MEISNLTAKYYSTGRINPNLVVLKLVCTLESFGEPMKSVSYLPETDLIGLGCDLNFEIKKKKKSPYDSNEHQSLGVLALSYRFP